MNTRMKKRTNARTIRIRTQWAKVNAHDYVGTDRYFEDLLWDVETLKSNPNKRCGFYMPTCPDVSKEIESDTFNFDDEEIEYLINLAKEA